MKINRDWATPLTIGAFSLMAITGLLMFFHLDRGVNKLAHEWLGWVMVIGVALHASVNWPAFKRHLLDNRTGRGILAVSALVILGSFASWGGKKSGGLPPPVLAMRAVLDAPLATVAPLTGQPVDALMAELKAVGIELASADQPLASVTSGDREREARALNTLFKARP